MDEIERTITLPKHAHAPNDYGRAYAFAKPGKVLAVYLIPSAPRDPSEGCSVADKYSDFRPCTKREVERAHGFNAAIRASQVQAGKRVWLNDSRRLPSIFDGGCTQITVEYDAVAKRFLHVVCNGLG